VTFSRGENSSGVSSEEFDVDRRLLELGFSQFTAALGDSSDVVELTRGHERR
jgi:hypothetical protein